MVEINKVEMLNEDLILQYSCEQGSTVDEYIAYLCHCKRLGEPLSWQDIADLVYDNFGIKYSRHFYSRHAEEFKLLESRDGYVEDEDVIEDSNPLNEIKEQLLELQKERVKLSDERSQNRAYVRKLAREDAVRELAFEVVSKLDNKKFLDVSCKPAGCSDVEAILMLSDWHYGILVDNFWNKYNPEVCRERVAKLLLETKIKCAAEKVDTIHVLNLADLIAGRIHTTIRLQSRADVITQIMEVSEILAELLYSLASDGLNVHYYSCTDNHSRIEPKKEESLDLESLCRITDWYLKSRLSSVSGIEIHDNQFGDDIITCNVMGHNVLGVHGDKDRQNLVIEKLTLMTRQSYDLICTAHLHHFSADEHTGTVLVSNGALMGADDYAIKLRLHSKPSQNLIFVTRDNVTEQIHRILL